MKKIHYLLGIALLFAGMPVCAQVSNDNEDEVYKVARPQAKDFVPGQVLFKLKDGQQAKVRRAGGQTTAGISSLDKVLKEYAVQEMEQLLPNAKVKGTPRRAKAYNGQTIVERDLTQLYKVTLPEEKSMQTLQLVEKLKALPEVEYAEPNYKVYLMDSHIADDYKDNPHNTQQWYLDDYGVKELWNKDIVNPKRPVIAIIDTGVDLTHPDLKDNLWTNTAEAEGEAGFDNDNNGFKGDVHGWDFINNTGNIRDNNMHGTHVAGIAAACNNDIGIVGANPQALIMAISVMQSDGSGDIATIAKGIDYAAQNGADVLNLSLGTYANSRTLRQALERAYHSAVIVAAAGNDGYPVDPECGISNPSFPGAYSFVLGVQATIGNGNLAYFSNFDCNGPNYSSVSTLQDPDGFNYELMAPGVNLLSTVPGGKYRELSGTSMATPLVAGAISALKMVKQYDTQEILWGDLLHSSNIAEAFAVPNRPAELDLVKVMLKERKELADETEDDYKEIYGSVKAGETVNIYPVIRTTFGAASNIQLRLEMGDDLEDASVVTITTPTASFGMPLSAYGKGVSLNPLQLQVSSTVADARHIKMKVVATCDESDKTFVLPFTIVADNMVNLSGMITSDRTLTADHVYYVNENLSVREGATLTIEPGTRLEFAEGMGLASFGKLVANGTPEKPIVFTRHTGEGPWMGVASHQSSGKVEHGNVIYTNADYTKFTLERTDDTPVRVNYQISQGVYYDAANEDSPSKTFWLMDYIENEYSNDTELDMTSRTEQLTDPGFLTPAVLRAMADWKAYYQQFPTEPTGTKTNWASVEISLAPWITYDNPRDEISYCRIEGYSPNDCYYPILKDCVLEPYENSIGIFHNLRGDRVNISNTNGYNEIRWDNYQQQLKYSNIINNTFQETYLLPRFSDLHNNNYFNNFSTYTGSGKYNGKIYSLAINTSDEDVSKYPSYIGTAKESVIRPYVFEIGNAPETFGSINLENMPTRPYAEAHGIVWKVLVDDKDAQDEYADLAPLGVGKHKFQVYFNRPMNKAIAPNVFFGVRDPWTQNAVDETGDDYGWNAEGTVYTAYKTINGRTNSDGVNRIYIYGAQDNEFFEIPYEKTRFNFQINAAGSLATGFAAEAGMGQVKLTWNNDDNDFDDAMGFNIYRYTIDENEKADTVRLNTEILAIETETYADYDVIPGQDYYYYYKVLSTDLQEYDVSNVVHAKPLTSTLGDANGSGDVDVSDVITTVNYITGGEAKPFIFEAADMNKDKSIDVLDVIGIIQVIMSTSAPEMASVEATAVYTVEDGVLYVESPVALAGVQAQVNSLTPNPSPKGEGSIAVASDLDGFEQVTAWLTDNDMLFLAYNMNGKTLAPGKHALLKIGDADVTKIRLSDTLGHNVEVVAGEGTTAIDNMGSKVQLQGGVYNLKGQKVSGKAGDLQKLPKGVYIINGEKVVK